MKRHYQPPAVRTVQLRPLQSLLDTSGRATLKLNDTASDFNKDNQASDWLTHKKTDGDKDFWE